MWVKMTYISLFFVLRN